MITDYDWQYSKHADWHAAMYNHISKQHILMSIYAPFADVVLLRPSKIPVNSYAEAKQINDDWNKAIISQQCLRIGISSVRDRWGSEFIDTLLH
jgi:hypothetical protein